jgi:hypothetical protein
VAKPGLFSRLAEPLAFARATQTGFGQIPTQPADIGPYDPAQPFPRALAETPISGAQAVGEAITNALATRGISAGPAVEPLLPDDPATEDGLRLRMPHPVRDHFESRIGFVVQGAVVSRAVASRAQTDLHVAVLQAGDGYAAPAVLRVEHATDFQVPQGRVASVAVRFGDGRCAVLAALAGYVGHVVVTAQGVANVSYVPSSNHWRWAEYTQRKDELDRLRAMVALAMDNDAFALRSQREATALAERIRLYDGMDPTLGLYAAHAFSQAGNDAQVYSVLEHMRQDMGAEFFDVRLLASHRLQQGTTWPVVPLCPLLTQSWHLLRARGVQLPARLQAAQRWLCDSLWTTFEAEAADDVFEAINSGELQ